MPKAYLLVGDPHGDMEFAARASLMARQHNAEILCLGDWGFLWPGHDQLKKLSDMLVGDGTTMYFIDGNHDDHPSLRKLIGPVREHGVTIAKSVIYQPRGSVHEDGDGTRFLFLGGAPSIDRAFRTEGRSWWPEEVITDEEFDRAFSAVGPIHVLVTHDAPAYPPGFSAKGSPDYKRACELSMKRVDKLVRKHRPLLHVHGHWHSRYERQHATGTHVVGLDCNLARFEDAVLLWSREMTA
jgi:hypothetical protein